jgi:hypothetical protein
MNFYLTALYKSFSSPSWLASHAGSTKKAAWFFVFTVLTISLIFSFAIGYRELPYFVREIDRVVESEIPEFTATFTDGLLTVDGLEQPYVREVPMGEGEPSLTVIIDTVSTSTLTIERFVSSTEQAILFTRSFVVSTDPEIMSTTPEDYAEIPNMSFSKAQAREVLGNIGSSWRPVITASILTLTFLLWGLGLLAYITLVSSLIFVVYRKTTTHPRESWYTWKDVFTLSIFAFGLPKIVITLIVFGFFLPIPYVVTIALVVAVFRALSHPKSADSAKGTDIPTLI